MSRTETNVRTGKVTIYEDAPVQVRPQTEIDAEFNAQVDVELTQIYLDSIPLILEYIGNIGNAPQELKDLSNLVSTKQANKR